jgi:putative acetyltransferase
MVKIRSIKPSDNQSLATIIRSTLAEFGANHPGTVFYDASTDSLFEVFNMEKSAYFVAEIDGKIVGGGGIYPTEGLPGNTCELVKMYLLPEARGIGLGRELLEKCIAAARNYGFGQVYLETMPELKMALRMYEKSGFSYLCSPMGQSGHFGCDLYMSRMI